MLIGLHIVYDCFIATTQLDSCDKDYGTKSLKYLSSGPLPNKKQ